MAADYGIRLILDGLELTEAPDILGKLIKVLETNTLTIGFKASYIAGDRVYNVTMEIGTVVTPDVGYEILVDSTRSQDFKAEVLEKVLRVLNDKTISLFTTGVYSAGTTSFNQVTLTPS